MRYITIFNHSVSINQRKTLPEMANIGIGDPIRIRMRKFYGIYMDYPASKHDEWGKKIEEETILKKSVPIVQAIVRTQMKVVEADNASL